MASVKTRLRKTIRGLFYISAVKKTLETVPVIRNVYAGSGEKGVPQGLKPDVFSIVYGPTKVMPDIQPSFSAACEAVPFV
jgi:hypothetical protein